MENTVPQKPEYDKTVPLNSFHVIIFNADATESRPSTAVLRDPIANSFTCTEDATHRVYNTLITIAPSDTKHGVLTDTADVNVQYRVHPIYIKEVILYDAITNNNKFHFRLKEHANAKNTVILPIIPFPSEEYSKARAIATTGENNIPSQSRRLQCQPDRHIEPDKKDKKDKKLVDTTETRIKTAIKEHAIKISCNEGSPEENAVAEQQAEAFSRLISGEATIILELI